MKPARLILVTLLLLTALPFSAAADEFFVIDHYQVDIDVMENNSYNITEVIDVNFTEERHGIYRDLPIKFDDMPVMISNISVPGHEMKVEKDSDFLTIRIGSADSYVSGKVSYTIKYTYDVGADNLPDMDEFNHNIIGDQWGTTIYAVDFKVRMPKDFPAEYVNCTSGYYGDTDSSNVAWEVKGRTITGRTLSPLEAGEALTLALPLPEGYWVGAIKHKPAGWLFFTIFGYPVHLIVIVLAFILWYTKGRDNKLFPSVEFEPPEGMNPSEVGYVIDGRVDSKDVTSLILYWADKGFLEIEEETKGKAIFKHKLLTLIKVKDLNEDAKSYEATVFNKLFSLGDGEKVTTKELSNKFYTTIGTAQKEIKQSFTKNPERAVYKKGSGGLTVLTAFLSALPVMFLLAQAFLPLMGSAPLALMGVPFSLFIVIPSLMMGSAITGQSDGGKAQIIFAVLFGGFSVIFFGFFTVVASGIPLAKFISAIGSSIVVNVFTAIMSQRTEYGDKILEKTLGFKEFINTAEKEKLEEMFETNPDYFYNILPYAIVLGLSDKWSAHFDGMAVQPPRWYRGYHYSTFSAAAFTSNLNNSFNTMNSSMVSSPSSGSSGSSSGGGFSGGGSGGGGGGSW